MIQTIIFDLSEVLIAGLPGIEKQLAIMVQGSFCAWAGRLQAAKVRQGQLWVLGLDYVCPDPYH